MSTPKSELPKTYNAREYEDNIYRKWEKSGYFNPDVCVKKGVCEKDAPVFSMMMPPPNVTGVLHLGHALENSLMDTITRYQRMQGKRTLFLPGTDHAAVATQSRVEQNLIESGKYKNPRQELGREVLLKIIREYSEDCKTTILKQVKKMGSSCDWSRLAYTFDKERSEAVNTMFKKMYDDGLIYRGYRVVNWSVRGQSTCSDDELVHVEREAILYTFKYSKDFPISIATTRPETKLGDTAVAVNPDDGRYKKYIGKEFKIDVGAAKLLNIKIIADKEVDIKFGTGAVGVTPAHSQIDYEMYNQCKAQNNPINLISVIGEDGRMNKNAGIEYEGLRVKEAREKFIEYLRKNGLIEKEEKITQNVGTSDRFKDPVEVLPMEQWFVDVNKDIPGRDKSLKDLMREAVTVGHNNDPKQKIQITPEGFQKNYLQWIDNLRDWCISRQIWWGHRIPVWYCDTETQKHRNTETQKHENTETQKHRNTKTWDLKIYGEDTFEAIKNNTKTIETRAGKKRGEGKYWGDMKFGDSIEFHLANDKTDKIIESEAPVKRVIKNISHFKNIDEMLKIYSVETISPRKNASDVKNWWKKYPKLNERIKKYGIWTIELDETTPQFPPRQGGDKNGGSEIKVQEKSPGEGWKQDPDTLDTWFSSGLWTFSTLGWPNGSTSSPQGKTSDLKTYHPTTFMQMGYEILFFWMARMILMSAYGLNEIPFKNVYIHGMLRDEKGKKFSKSDKIGTDPLEMIEQYGTDALRLSLLLGTTPGNDSKFYEEKIRGSRNFVNKLWNVSRYILINTKYAKNAKLSKMRKTNLTLADKWILSELNKTIKEVTKSLEKFQFSHAGEMLYEFTWTKLADWYLEISKVEIGKDNILAHILTNLLKLWHPFAPFVTEQIWSSLNDDLLMIQKWPKADEKLIDAKSVAEFEKLQEIVTMIRNTRADLACRQTGKKIEPKEIIKIGTKSKEYKKLAKEQKDVIERLGRCEISDDKNVNFEI